MVRPVKSVMSSSNHPGILRSRRDALGILALGTVAFGSGAALAKSDDVKTDNVLTEAAVLRDPDIPVAGNRDGDVTIVEYFDYQCPYCRKVEPELRQVAQDDGKVRLIFKDWPILGGPSIYAARMALATGYQEKYIEAHDAMIGLNARLTEAGARDLLAKAGVDVDHVNKLGWTALLEAIILGNGGASHQQIVQLLVDAKANVNLADRDGVSPLRHARNRGFSEIAQILVNAGAR